jgi:hypothetical protein
MFRRNRSALRIVQACGVTRLVFHSSRSNERREREGKRNCFNFKSKVFFSSKELFVRISPRIAMGSLSNATWYSLRMPWKHCKLGWSRSVIKGTLLLTPKQLFVPISPRIAVGLLSNTTWYHLHMCYKQCMPCWSQSVMKGTLLLRSKVFRQYLP